MIEIFEQSVKDFYVFFNKLNKYVGPPKFINISGFPKFRYAKESIETLCLIKTGRILSSLNSIVVLFERGFFLEIAVLLRTIKECCADLSFLLENYPDKKLSKSQEQYINEFFAEEFSDSKDPVQTIRKHNRVPSKKIHAGYARNIYNQSELIKDSKLKSKIQKLANPSDHQKTTLSILNVYSGYVHYGYSQSVEIIAGSPPRYHLEGMADTPMVNEWQKFLTTEIVALYNHFAFLCIKFNFEKELEFFKSKR
ncbi:hypothetical protein KKF86_00400, partial [bacterium]|nr:hypothetical protein [bacterium]